MKKLTCILYFFLALTYLYSQNKPLIKYTFSTGVRDTLLNVSFDSTLTNSKTDFYLGRDTLIEYLPQTAPSQNLYAGTQFTRKSKAASDFNLNRYPIRTAIKLFEENDDTLSDNCSGIMISKKHVLTAAHCFLSFFSDSIFSSDSILACPAYDNGLPNASFPCSYANSVYYFKNRSLSGEDIAVIELNDTIGSSTGWVGIGFNQVDSSLLNGTFFKFSYPATSIPSIDTNSYNGDTLYYNYGVATLASSASIGITGTNGIPGESGSSLLKVSNGFNYTSYGTLSFSTHLNHSRINNYEFFAIRNIIEPNLLNSIEEYKSNPFHVYPNPTNGTLTIESENSFNIEKNNIQIIDLTGRVLFERRNSSFPQTFDLSFLRKGVYFILLNQRESFRIIKS